MHGGSEMNPNSTEFVSDAQLHVSIPKDVEVNIGVSAKGPVRVVAINTDEFPYEGSLTGMIIADSQE